MPTTTIRIDEALKARIAAAAERVGKSSHAFILDALSETVERVEMDQEMHRIVDKRWSVLPRTDETVSWSDAKAYMQAAPRARRLPGRPPASRRVDKSIPH